MAGTLELQFADNNGSFDNRLRHYEGTYISVLLRNARKWSETKNGMDVWRIIRREDNMVIAQSKATFAPAVTSTPAPEAAQAERVAGAESPVARFQVFNNVIDCDPMSFDEETDVIEHLREYRDEGENLRGYLVVEHTVARAFYLQNLVESINAETWLAEHAPDADSEIPFAAGVDDSEPVFIITDDNDPVMTEIRDAIRASLPVASEPTDEGVFKVGDTLIGQANIYTHNANDMPRPVAIDWRRIHQATWLFTERENVTGHGRTSRNRENARKGAKNAKTTRNGSTLVMMEKNTENAAKWREKRNLANAVAMPQPTITGAELLARGIQLVEKPKPMTRTLETRNRKAT